MPVDITFATVIIALGIFCFLILRGVASVIWAKRCHPKNPSFKIPSTNISLMGGKGKMDD